MILCFLEMYPFEEVFVDLFQVQILFQWAASVSGYAIHQLLL